MSNISLTVGLKALLASQSALETAGHNVSNANTVGYSRQEVLLSSNGSQILRGIAIGNGVDAGAVRRIADQFLGARISSTTGTLGMLDARLQGLSQIEAMYGEPGDDGISAKMQSLFASFSSLAQNPSEPGLRQGVASAAIDLVKRFQSLSSDLGSVTNDARTQLFGQAKEVTALGQRIATLNRKIRDFESAGQPANDLRDQRDEAVRAVSAFTDARATEDSSGSVTVLIAGQMLVGPVNAYAVTAENTADGSVALRVAGHPLNVTPKSGSLAGLISIANDASGKNLAGIDSLAKQLIFQLNRAHSTGVPSSGPFRSLTGQYALADQNGDNLVTDELLSQAGLAFPVSKGELRVSVTNNATGAIETTKIAIDPDTMTVGDLVSRLDGIAHLSAAVGSDGKLNLTADSGYGFDFAQRLTTSPDVYGTLGGASATIGSSREPFALANGNTLQLATNSGSATITFQTGSFANIGQATAEEVAAAINADPQTASIGAHAVAVDGRLFLQTTATGSSATIQSAGGTALTAMGFSPGQNGTGQTNSVSPTISGTYTGSTNETYTFVPAGTGTIGSTPTLGIDVFNSAGDKITTLSVGQGYTPGTPIAFANGLSVSFQLGDIARDDGQSMSLEAVADADTSDVLAALGVNALMTGTTAADIGLRGDIETDPSRLATSGTGAAGDNSTARALASVGDSPLSSLDGLTVRSFYASLVVTMGSEASSTQGTRDTEAAVMDGLVKRRESLSGVNIDEELVNFERFQQTYQAAARFLSVVNQLQQDLMNLV